MSEEKQDEKLDVWLVTTSVVMRTLHYINVLNVNY